MTRRLGRAFTILELMVVVAIVALLAAIALPSYQSYKLRAARSELTNCVEGIKVSQQAHEAANGAYLTEPAPQPDATPGKTRRPWVSGSAFDQLGWEPDGDLYGSYGTTDMVTDFIVNGATDVDGDAVPAQMTASNMGEALLTTPTDVY